MLLRRLAMQEARAGLTELVFAGSGADQLRRSEGRFRALAADCSRAEGVRAWANPGVIEVMPGRHAEPAQRSWRRLAPGAWSPGISWERRCRAPIIAAGLKIAASPSARPMLTAAGMSNKPENLIRWSRDPR